MKICFLFFFLVSIKPSRSNFKVLVQGIPTDSQFTSEDSKEEAPASKTRKLSALDNSNTEFERLLRRRKTQPMNVNHVSANIVSYAPFLKIFVVI